jgi:riboflavin biosynthesis pyrimidine reductase
LDAATLAEAYQDVRRARRPDRPWLLVNMIASVDGATALEGTSGGLGGSGDRAVFAVIRALPDVILVGGATVRAEHYGPPRRADQRIAVVTRGDMDWTMPLFASGAAMAVLPEDGPPVPVPAIRAGRGRVDLRAAVALLPGDVVLAEGGPSLNGQLAAAGLVDELCVTIAPKLVSGTAERLAHGPASATADLELAHVLEDDGFLFCRYVRREHSPD